MNIEEFRNKAYEIATGNYLTETFNEEKFDELTNEEIELYCYSEFKNTGTDIVSNNIEKLASDIIKAYKHLIFGSDVIINDNALFEDTVEGLATRVKDDLTEEQVREFLDEDEMSFVMEKMFDAQSDAIIEIEERAIRHFKKKEQ